MTAPLRGKLVPTTPNPIDAAWPCSFCDDPILSMRGIVVEQGAIYCTERCHTSAVAAGRHPR